MHRGLASLKSELVRLGQTVRVGDEYAHYAHPGRRYRIISIGVLEASQELCVIYQAISKPDLVWVRPVANFLEEIQTPAGKVPRFSKIKIG